MFVGEDGEKGFYVRNFATEGVGDADGIGGVGLYEGGALGWLGNDVVDEDAAVDEIDLFVVGDELVAVKFKFPRIGDHGGDTHFFEARLQNFEFAVGGDVFPIDNGDLRRTGGAAPIDIARYQSVEKSGAERVTVDGIALSEFPHNRKFAEYFR